MLLIYDHWDESVICVYVFLVLYNRVWWGICCMDTFVMTCNESYLISGINQTVYWIIYVG